MLLLYASGVAGSVVSSLNYYGMTLAGEGSSAKLMPSSTASPTESADKTRVISSAKLMPSAMGSPLDISSEESI